MRRQLLIAVILIGGFVAVLNTVLVGYSAYADNRDRFEALQVSNKQAEATNEKNAAAVAQWRKESAEVKKGIGPGACNSDSTICAPATVQAEDWIAENQWIVTTAVLGLGTFLLLAVGILILVRRDQTLPITWAQALTLAGVAFFFLILVNGIIPDRIMFLWDNVLKQRGTFTVPGTKAVAQLLNEGAKGWVWDWEVPRDLIVATWYGIGFVGTVLVWYWAQEWPKRLDAKEAASGGPKSPYGRPLTASGR